jgi:hypothetical protein
LIAPAGLIALLLLVATGKDGTFDLRYWAPLTVLALLITATMQQLSGNRSAVRQCWGPFKSFHRNFAICMGFEAGCAAF